MVQITSANDENVVISPDRDTPFAGNVRLSLTQAEFNGVVAFLRELRPGIYVKCAICNKLKYNEGTITIERSGMFKCEGCV